MFLFITITVIHYLYTLLQILIIIVQSNMEKTTFFFKNQLKTKLSYLNSMYESFTNLLFKPVRYLLNIDGSKINVHIRYIFLFYTFYLITLSLVIFFYSSVQFNFFYYVVYFHMLLANIFYVIFNLLSNFVVFNSTFLVNFDSIYLLNSLDDLKFSKTLSVVIDLKVADFYTFVILDYINNLLNFSYSLYLNYLNYPIFILFAVLFFFSSFFSLLSLSYLGFYGVFFFKFYNLV